MKIRRTDKIVSEDGTETPFFTAVTPLEDGYHTKSKVRISFETIPNLRSLTLDVGPRTICLYEKLEEPDG